MNENSKGSAESAGACDHGFHEHISNTLGGSVRCSTCGAIVTGPRVARPSAAGRATGSIGTLEVTMREGRRNMTMILPWQHYEAIASYLLHLDESAEPAMEPVAWRYRYRDKPWSLHGVRQELRDGWEQEPLYTAPVLAALPTERADSVSQRTTTELPIGTELGVDAISSERAEPSSGPFPSDAMSLTKVPAVITPTPSPAPEAGRADGGEREPYVNPEGNTCAHHPDDPAHGQQCVYYPPPDDLVRRLRNTPNWLRQDFGNWKDATSHYDRAPFEAADAIEARDRTIAEWQKVTAHQTPESCHAGIATMYGKWQSELQRAEQAESALAIKEKALAAVVREADEGRIVAADGDYIESRGPAAVIDAARAALKGTP